MEDDGLLDELQEELGSDYSPQLRLAAGMLSGDAQAAVPSCCSRLLSRSRTSCSVANDSISVVNDPTTSDGLPQAGTRAGALEGREHRFAGFAESTRRRGRLPAGGLRQRRRPADGRRPVGGVRARLGALAHGQPYPAPAAWVVRTAFTRGCPGGGGTGGRPSCPVRRRTALLGGADGALDRELVDRTLMAALLRLRPGNGRSSRCGSSSTWTPPGPRRRSASRRAR